MVVVDDLEEWRDLGGLLELHLAHLRCDLAWTLADTSNEGMTVWASTITNTRKCMNGMD